MATNDWSAVISAVSALLALGFSIFVYFRTQSFVLPMERPIIELIENKCTGALSDDRNILLINMVSIFQNVGKHTASELRIQIGMCSIEAVHEFRNYVDAAVANDIRPGTKFNWDQRMGFPVKIEGEIVQLPKLELILYIRVTYDDAWQLKRKRYVDDFYLAYTAGHASAAHGTSAQRKMIQEYVERIYQG